MPIVHLDEAGNTGPDLVNIDQPIYSLASTIVSEDEATELLRRHFGVRQSDEIKHSKLAKRSAGQVQLASFFTDLVGRDRVAGYFAVHKLYAALGYLLDFWLEPLMHRDGVDFYERGLNIAFLNVAWMTLGATLGLDGLRELLRRFQVMTRNRNKFTYASFWRLMAEAIQRHELIARILTPLLVAERRLGPPHLMGLPNDLLDLGDYGILPSVGYWRDRLPGEQLELVHDESKAMRRNATKWAAILDPSNPRAIVGYDRRTISFPLPVSGIRMEDSNQKSSIQVADLVAGAAVSVLKTRLSGAETPYSKLLEQSGFLTLTLGGVWPSDSVRPEELETEGPVFGDPADHMARLLGDLD